MRDVMWRLAFLLTTISATLEGCPWLNAATAGGFLGGPATETKIIRPGAGDDAACTFISPESSLTELRIEVNTMAAAAKDFRSYSARCQSQVMPLKAIGNEALLCNDDTRDGRVAAQVVGRVRNRAFVVRIVAKGQSVDRAMLREKCSRLAEQVAGILF